MEAALAALAALAVVAGAAGVIVGAWLTERREDKRWLKDQKLRGVSEFLTSTGQLHDVLRSIGDGDLSAEAKASLRQPTVAGRSTVHLLCEESTRHWADELFRHVHYTNPALPQEYHQHVIELLRRVTLCARMEIGTSRGKAPARSLKRPSEALDRPVSGSATAQ